MKITMHDMAVGTFVPMLESLSEVLAKGAAHAASAKADLVNARLAPDMFTLAQQVQQACHYARDGVSRLTGKGGAAMEAAETTFPALRDQIARTLDVVRAAPAAAFDGAEERDCSIEIPGDMVIRLSGLQLLRAWSIPHFYFHVVTAYDILRHNGVAIGKRDYLSQVGRFIRPRS
ncbi:MAG TPA: DUF1993 domain-containing protein [Candidatus Eisenbacteria bacterium]|nr:DUF1993 domain-containing protein [Candidatus Eisenbacteria bacterium]